MGSIGTAHGAMSKRVISISPEARTQKPWKFRAFKRTVDVFFSIAVLPVVGLLYGLLLLLNPVFNPGPVFYIQPRMGRGGALFNIWKFRTMRPHDGPLRGATDPVEDDRISGLGSIMRRSRIDELPNVINILRGEMSLVGPRPDAWDHAENLIDTVPHYAERFDVLPGITGLAQVKNGYANTTSSIKRKSRLDRHYVRRSSVRLELRIMIATALVMVSGSGAK